MKLLQKNSEIPYQMITVVDDLNQYYSTLELVLFGHVSGTITLVDNGLNVDLHIMNSIFDGSVYRYTCVPEKTYRLINSVMGAVEGNYTVKGVLARVGVRNAIKTDSLSSYWRIPSCKLTVLFEYLENYAVFNRGGCPKFYIDINGDIQCYDLRSVASSIAENISVSITEDACDIDWIPRYPGMVDMWVYSKDGIRKKQLTFEKGYGNGVCRVNDTTGHEADMMEAMLRNTFYGRYYTARVLSATHIFVDAQFGKHYKINGRGSYMLMSRTAKVTPNAAPEVMVTFGGRDEDS